LDDSNIEPGPVTYDPASNIDFDAALEDSRDYAREEREAVAEARQELGRRSATKEKWAKGLVTATLLAASALGGNEVGKRTGREEAKRQAAQDPIGTVLTADEPLPNRPTDQQLDAASNRLINNETARENLKRTRRHLEETHK